MLKYNLSFKQRQMLEILSKVKVACSEHNWDGYDAKAINKDSYKNVLNFALLLPGYLPVPEIYTEPDGEVVFEWYEDKRKVFSVSIGNTNKLSYAGLFNESKIHGVEYFCSKIPEIILNNINQTVFGVTNDLAHEIALKRRNELRKLAK